MLKCLMQTSDRSDGGLNYPRRRGLQGASQQHPWFTLNTDGVRNEVSLFASADELLSRKKTEQFWTIFGERELTIGGKSTVIRKLEACLILSVHHSPALLAEETRAIRCIRGLGDAVPIRTCSIIQVPLSRTTFHASLHINLAKPHTTHREPSGILCINLKKHKYHVCGAGNMVWLVRSSAF